MSGVGPTATRNVLLLRTRRWNVLPSCGITQQVQMKYEMKNSNPHNAQREKNPALCSRCCVRIFTLIGSSAPPRQVPQISLILTAARETGFLLCATLVMLISLQESPSFQKKTS